jgi:uncharacterized damage-inducible protein DinB
VGIHEIHTSYDYLAWAHERTMATVFELTSEEFTCDLSPGPRSVRDTLVHMMSSEWLWLSRWHGVSPGARLDPEAFPTPEAVEERWRRIRAELQRFLGQVREPDLLRPLPYVSTEGEERRLPLACAMEHVVNHATYHRGQVAALLRRLGKEPLATDLVLYYLEEEPGSAARAVARWEHTHAAGRGGGAERRPEEEEDED